MDGQYFLGNKECSFFCDSIFPGKHFPGKEAFPKKKEAQPYDCGFNC